MEPQITALLRAPHSDVRSAAKTVLDKLAAVESDTSPPATPAIKSEVVKSVPPPISEIQKKHKMDVRMFFRGDSYLALSSQPEDASSSFSLI